MVFSSIEFMFRFLPIFLIVYFAAAPKYRNIILLIGSLIFYGVGEPSYIILMILSILVNHFAAVNIYTSWKREDDTQASTETNRKVWLIAAMVFNFGMLFVFKYLNFFIGIINGIAGTTVLKLVSLTLPLGISFYTFQAASYVIDIYRRKYEIANGLLDFATYLCMFPQLIAGPIVSFSEVKDDLHKQRKISLPKIEWGTTIFVLGLAYKVLLANKIASLWNTVMTAGVMGIHPLTAWLGSWGFSMQLFFDFFGYSLMAIGLGRILGFKFPTNFKNPYCATSSTDFWRRWHISLSTWFREYLYIPLGGNRKGKAKTYWNKLIVFFCTGLWHGANWTFIVWGLWHGFFIVAEDAVKKLFGLEKHGKGGRNPACAVLKHLYTLLVVLVGFVIFRADNMGQAFSMIGAMFSGGSASAQTGLLLAQCLTPLTLFALAVGLVGSTPVLPLVCRKAEQQTGSVYACLQALSYAGVLALLLVDILHLSAASYVPFIYFQF